MYDYYLGGKDNFACDREAAERVLAGAPQVRRIATANRAFLGRAVRFLARSGIRQFIDLGAGLPTQRNVHDVAQEIIPDARVAYVDNDPIVLTHGRALLGGAGNTSVIQADLRHPDDVLGHPELRGLIDLAQPVGLLFFSVLHFVPAAEDPQAIVARYRDAVTPGSYLALSSAVDDLFQRRAREQVEQVYVQSKAASGGGLTARNDVLAYFGDFELVSPGLVSIVDWRPDEPAPVSRPEEIWLGGGVARKPSA
jgi:hypothetical protein